MGRLSGRALVVACAVVGMLGATAAFTVLTATDARRDARLDQGRRADQAAAALRTALLLTVDRLSAAAISLGNHSIDPSDPGPHDTDEALAHLFGQPALWGTGLALAVDHGERAVLERRLGRPITDLSGGRAARRDRYVVPVAVRYRDGSTAGLGADLASDPVRGLTLERAAITGTPQITAPVRLLGGRTQLLVAYAPIMRGTGASLPQSLQGYVVGAYRGDTLLTQLRGVVGPGTRFALRDRGVTVGRGDAALHDAVTRTVAAGGRRFELSVGRPPVRAQSAVIVGVAGSIISLLVALLLAVGLRREDRAVHASAVDARRREHAEASFAAAFEQAPIGIAIIDAAGRIEEVNAAFSSFTGYPAAVLAGRPLPDFVHPEDREDAAQTIRRLGRDDGASETEQRLLTADGRVVWTAITATAMSDGDASADRLLLHCEDVSDRRAYEARLQHLANHDPLTGLLNRRAFTEELERHAARVRRYGDRGALLMIDVDHFKAVNDVLGHSAGDRVIIDVARGLQSRLRESDVVARLGADEFAVLLPEADEAQAQRVAETLLADVRALVVPGALGPRPISASIGLHATRATDDVTAEALMMCGDLALLDAKEAGRNCVVRYAPGPSDSVRTEARLSWVDRIHRALESDDFVLRYQPIVDLPTGRTVAAEALVRLRNADGDLVLPGAFLEIAERYDLAPRLDRWVLEHAIADLATVAADAPDVTIAVNLSARSLADPELLPALERMLREHDVNPSSLMLELTETTAVSDIPQAQAFARRLHALGCRLALDDFGTGFGSFYYLKHLPFDVLKIDGEFVRSCVENELDRRIVAAIVDIARSAGSVTVGEHAGNQACVNMLRDLGVDRGQGYQLGVPDTLSALRSRLAEERAEACPARTAPHR